MMTFKAWRPAGAVAVLLACSLATTPAQAVFLEADSIEADGAFSTVDLWFFSFDADSTATIQANDLGGPPVSGADPDMIIYVDDGTFSNVFAVDDGAGSDPSITDFFAAGSYIAVVANHLLSVGDFGPTLADAALAVGGYDYEFNGPEPDGGDIAISCLLSGNLDGSYSKRVFGRDTCRLPPTANLPEPGTFGLLALGLLGVGAAVRRRRAR